MKKLEGRIAISFTGDCEEAKNLRLKCYGSIYAISSDYTEDFCIDLNHGGGHSPKAWFTKEGYEVIDYKEYQRRLSNSDTLTDYAIC